MEAFIFMFCLTLHNVEEALWLTDWREKVMQSKRRSPKKAHFIFAVLGITVFGYLVSCLYLLYPDIKLFAYCFIGFVSTMLINVIAPHLLLTVKYKRYCPGIATGLLLIVPLNTLILIRLHSHFSSLEILLSMLIVGVFLLAAIPTLEKLAKSFLRE